MEYKGWYKMTVKVFKFCLAMAVTCLYPSYDQYDYTCVYIISWS